MILLFLSILNLSKWYQRMFVLLKLLHKHKHHVLNRSNSSCGVCICSKKLRTTLIRLFTLVDKYAFSIVEQYAWELNTRILLRFLKTLKNWLFYHTRGVFSAILSLSPNYCFPTCANYHFYSIYLNIVRLIIYAGV